MRVERASAHARRRWAQRPNSHQSTETHPMDTVPVPSTGKSPVKKVATDEKVPTRPCSSRRSGSRHGQRTPAYRTDRGRLPTASVVHRSIDRLLARARSRAQSLTHTHTHTCSPTPTHLCLSWGRTVPPKPAEGRRPWPGRSQPARPTRPAPFAVLGSSSSQPLRPGTAESPPLRSPCSDAARHEHVAARQFVLACCSCGRQWTGSRGRAERRGMR